MRAAFLVLLLAGLAAAHMYDCRKEECSCDGHCTNAFPYWKSHNAYSWFSFARRPWPVPSGASPVDVLAHPHSEDRAVCGVKWFEILKLEVGKPNDPHWGRPQIDLAREWVAARLNRWAGACTTPRLDELVATAGGLLGEWCGTTVLSASDPGEAMLQLSATLKLYNGGGLGPGACGCGDGIVQEREDCDLGDANGAPGSCCTDKCSLAPAGTPCRDSAGPCDLAEYCTGSDPVCPPDGFEPEETVCRASRGACDRPEHCTGTAAQCPHDGLRREGWVCRAADGLCDRAELCDGASPECPADGIHDAGHACREAAGDCDIPEVCDGKTRACPLDQLLPRGTPCREAAAGDPCDCTDVCDGQAAACPAHDPLERFEYAIRTDTVVDAFDGGDSGSSGTLPWGDSSWIFYELGAGQDVAIRDGSLEVTYVSASGTSARRTLPALRDPAHLASIALKGKVVLSKAAAPVRVTIAVGPGHCADLTQDDVAWCGIVRSASEDRVTTEPLVTPSGREVPCDALNLARRLLFRADVDPRPFREASGPGCLAIWTGVAEGSVGSRPTTLLFNDLRLEVQTEVPTEGPSACGTILIPEAGQTVATGTCPLACPGSPGCLASAQ